MRPGWSIFAESFPLVFSDCLPWCGPAATWFACDCGYVGKACDAEYKAALEVSYGTYAPFHQGGGAEQAVTQDGRLFLSRSSQVLSWLLKENLIPSSGSTLDYGTGNGSFLKAAANLLPNMQLHAADISESHKGEILSLPGVNSFQVLPLPINDVQQFDVISLIHVLEHISDPIEVLTELGSRLAERGVIVVQVPDFSANAFDLVIADHLSHFTEESAKNLARAASFEVVKCATNVVKKELTLVLRRPTSALAAFRPRNSHVQGLISDAFAFLGKWKQQTSVTRTCGLPVTVFGSSIAASWVASLLEDGGTPVNGFLDEDLEREEGHLRGIQISPPSRVNMSDRGVVLVPLVPAAAAAVSARLHSLGFEPVFLP
jgi:SAM-dependent methyltransferase